ncbi:MAG: hypothetical protein ACJAZ2_000325 [Glaciecola sp.]|jgi:hypothetical protein
MNKNFLKKFVFPASTGAFVIAIYMLLPKYFEGKILGLHTFSATRLVLLLFMFFSLYFVFVDELRYRGTMIKILLRGCILSLLFTIFPAAGTILLYLKNPVIDVENYSLFESLLMQSLEFLKYGLLYTVLTYIWIYFHPQNITRRRKKDTKKQ